jgi:hypothetical protein
MRPRKRSAKIEARLDEVARMKFETPTYEELERETGLCVGYLRAVISAKVRELSNKNVVSRGA